jgi:hypothetical protein
MTRGDFEFLPHYCSCPCHGLIPLKKERLWYYETRGYPKFINHHISKTLEFKKARSEFIKIKNKEHPELYCGNQKGKSRPDFSEYLKEHNPNFEGKYEGQKNPMSKTSINQRKVKVAVERLETRRLELVAKQKQEHIEEQKKELTINPNKNWITCVIAFKKLKKCNRKHCKHYDFCHRVEPKKVKIKSEETDYVNPIKQLTTYYSAEHPSSTCI